MGAMSCRLPVLMLSVSHLQPTQIENVWKEILACKQGVDDFDEMGLPNLDAGEGSAGPEATAAAQQDTTTRNVSKRKQASSSQLSQDAKRTKAVRRRIQYDDGRGGNVDEDVDEEQGQSTETQTQTRAAKKKKASAADDKSKASGSKN